jgi:hypothetical protein
LIKCNIHGFFFDWSCHICKEEYRDLKGTNTFNAENNDKANGGKKRNTKLKNYKEFDEERAKKLFEQVFLQYLKNGNMNEEESLKRSKTIIRKQCEIRGIKPWSWI